MTDPEYIIRGVVNNQEDSVIVEGQERNTARLTWRAAKWTGKLMLGGGVVWGIETLTNHGSGSTLLRAGLVAIAGGALASKASTELYGLEQRQNQL